MNQIKGLKMAGKWHQLPIRFKQRHMDYLNMIKDESDKSFSDQQRQFIDNEMMKPEVKAKLDRYHSEKH